MYESAKFSTSVKLLMLAAGLAVSTMACDPPRFVQRDHAAEFRDVAAEAASPAAAKVFVPKSGDVLLVGGWTQGNKSTAKSEFFDPTTKKFFAMGLMPVTEAAAAGALVTVNSKTQLLIAGGFTGKSKFSRPKRLPTEAITGSSIENLSLLDTTTGAFAAATNPLDTPRAGATATLLQSGKVLIAGGVDANGHPLNTAEVFDPATQTVSEADNTMASPRAFHTATIMGDGTVVLIGGASDSAGGVTNTADVYDPGTNSFTPTSGQMGAARGGHAAVVLSSGPNSGRILVLGGVAQTGFGDIATNAAEVYNPATHAFSAASNNMQDLRAFPAATVLSDGTVLVTGGFANFDVTSVSALSGGATLASTFGSTLKSAEIYNPANGTFTCVAGKGSGGFICPASMLKARAAHSSTLLSGNQPQVLIAGGLGNNRPNSTSVELNEAELYNPATGKFAKVPSMKAGRAFAVAVLMP